MAEQKSRLVIEISTENAKRNAQALGRELRSIEKNGTYASKSMDSLSISARTLATQMAGIVTVGAAISKMDMFSNLQNRLKLVTQSQTELNRAMNDTFTIAQNTAQSWDSTAQIYQRFAQNAKSLGINLQEAASLTETVSKAIAISGGNAASSEAALVQFGQALSSGVLRGEEFNSIAEQASGLRDAIAKGLNISVSELRAWANEGKLTTDVIIEALSKAKVSVDQLFGKTDFSVGQGFVKLGNAVVKYVGELGKSTGASEKMYDTLEGLADNLDTVANVAMIGSAFWIGTYIPAIYKSTMEGYNKIKQLTEQTAVQLAAIAAEKTAATTELMSAESKVKSTRTTLAALAAEKALEVQRLKSQITDVGRIASTTRMAELRRIETQVTAQLKIEETALENAKTRTTIASTANLGIGRSLLGALGGPVGLGVTVASVAASYIFFHDKTKDSTASLRENNEKVEEAIKKYTELSKIKRADQLVAEREKLEELTEEQKKADVQLLVYASSMAKASDFTTQSQVELSKLFQEYKKTGDLNNFLDLIQKSTLISQKDKDEIIKRISALEKASEKVEEQNSLIDQMIEKDKKYIKNNENVTKSVDAKRVAQEKLTKTLRDAANKSLLDNQYWINTYNATLKTTGNKKTASNFSDFAMSWRKDNNIERDVRLTKEQSKILNELWAKDQEREKLRNDANKTEQEITKEKERQIQLQLLDNQELANGYKIYQAFLKAGLSKNQSLAMAAQVGRENDFSSKDLFGSHIDNNNGKTNVGMLSWQGSRATELLKYLRSRDLLNIDGRIKQTQEAIDAMAKFAAQEIFTKKEYITTRKAIMSGVDDYSELSKVFGKNYVRWDYAGNKINSAEHKQKEANYYQKLSNIVGDSNGGNIDFSSYKVDLEKLNQLKIELDSRYYPESKRKEIDHLKEISDLKLVYSGKELAEKIAQSEKQYQAETELSRLQFESQVYGWQWVGEEKIKNEAKVNKAVIIASKDLSDQQKAAHKKSIDEQAEYALAVFRETQRQKINELAFAVGGAGDQARNYLMERSNPSLYARNQLSSEKFGAQSQLNTNYQSQRGEIFNQGLDPEEQHAKLLEAEKQFLDSKQVLNEMYAQKETDLQQSQYQNQLQIWGSLLSQGQTMWSQLTQSVKNANGEQSSAYKAALLAQQAFSIASTLVSTHLAAAQVMADPSALTLAQKTMYSQMVLGLGYANAGLIAAQTIAGFSGGGLFNGSGHVRGDGTETSDSINARLSDYEYVTRAWAVKRIGVENMEYMNRTGEIPFQREYEALKMHVLMSSKDNPVSHFSHGGAFGGGDRVLNPQQNKDLTRYLGNGNRRSGGGVNFTQTIVIQSDGSVKSESQGEMKQLGSMIETAVVSVISRELRQGGLIKKAMSGG